MHIHGLDSGSRFVRHQVFLGEYRESELLIIEVLTA